MAFIELSKKENCKTRIMIFTEGTVLMHDSIIRIFDFSSYIPIGNCVEKIRQWESQNAEIIYCTSRKSTKQINQIVEVLKRSNLNGTKLYFRGIKEKYKDIVEQALPDVLIEDSCKSIGGSKQMCITYVKPEIKDIIRSIVVKEFKGIDNLPESIDELLNFN